MFKKHYVIYILIIPFIIISLLSMIVKVGTLHINTKEIIIDLNSPIKIGDYLTYYISILGIEVTSVLSYMLYKTSVKSNELAEIINSKEDKRNDEKIRESALIIYYDFISKISIIKELYTKYVLEKDIDINKNIIMKDDWIKTLTNLRSVLSRKELNKLFQLYNRFELIARFQKEDDDKRLEKAVENISVDIFLNILRNYLWMDYHVENECLLNYDYYKIFMKIEEKIDDKKVDQRIYLGDTTDFTLFNGKETYTDKNGQLVYEFNYVEGKIVNGRYYNYVNNIYEKIFEGELDNKFNIINGYTVKFDKNMRIEYKGEIKNNKYDGNGILYSRGNRVSGKFEGIFKDGKKHKGLWTSNDEIINFDGEYKNGIPYTGMIECSKTKCIGDAYSFKGEIEKGKPINGHGYIENRRTFDEEFLAMHPHYANEDNYDEQEYYHEEIPYEIEQEMIEDNIRCEKENYRTFLSENCEQIVELLESNWNDGVCKSYPDDMLYKDFFGYKHGTEK